MRPAGRRAGTRRRGARLGAAGATALVVAGLATSAVPASPVSPRTAVSAASGPVVQQLVVYRSGRATERTARAAQATVRASGRRCAVRAGTPLAALARSRVARLRLRDFGSCSASPRDGGSLFVTAIGSDVNRGQSGWVYKVGVRSGTAGAADPRGPFGRGLLRSRARVVWFFCRVATNCQRTLGVSPVAEGGGSVAARVTAYDDQGRGVPAAGARVTVGGAVALTGADGVARVVVPPGSHPVRAEQAGLVRSFTERVVAR